MYRNSIPYIPASLQAQCRKRWIQFGGNVSVAEGEPFDSDTRMIYIFNMYVHREKCTDTASRMVVIDIVSAMLLVVLFFAGCGERADEVQPLGPVYAVQRISGIPAVDGVLNDACWADAEVLHFAADSEASEAIMPTTARLVHDGAMLYVGFECQDTDASATGRDHDNLALTDDYVSIMIDADGDIRTSVLISVSPLGTVSDAFIVAHDRNRSQVLRDWNCDQLRVSVSVYGGGAAPGTEDRYWTVEMAVPFESVLTSPPEPGDVVGFAAIRVDVRPGTPHHTITATVDNPEQMPPQFGMIEFAE
jgi:hypothetical protein